MDVLDEKGRLFGVVNVIDALVVVVALALVAGGLLLVVGDIASPSSNGGPDADPEPEPLRYATVTYTAALDSQAAGLSPGAVLTTSSESYNVTDVLRSVTAGGNAHVTARLVYRGEFAPGGSRVLAGDSIEVASNDSSISVDVRAVGQEAGLVDPSRTSLVIAANSTKPAASAIAAGDEIRVAGDLVGTVEAVEHRSDGRTLFGLTVTARQTDAGRSFGGTLLRVGTQFGVVTEEAQLRGQIVALDTSDPTAVG